MKIPAKFLRSGFSIPIFGVGTWMMGGNLKRDPHNDDEGNRRALAAAIDAGLRHIDTAEAYGEGQAERIVGEVIKSCRRSELFLVSKVYRTNLKHDDVLRSFEGSIRRLGTDYLDLYLIHAANPEIPMEQTFSAMQKLYEQGVIRNIGVSNFTKERMQKAQELLSHKIVATQVHYNLIYREPAVQGVLDYCRENDIMVIAWRPVQKGELTENPPALVEELCRKYEKTPAQIAINWLLSQPNVVTLSTMRTKAHLNENLGALGWQMSESDVARLERDFPNQQTISPSVPLA